MDFDSIPYGVDFREHIKQTLQRAKVVAAIIGPEWCGGREPANRRIDDPTDFVRLEVATALENGRIYPRSSQRPDRTKPGRIGD